jgi:hypothetical protein
MEFLLIAIIGITGRERRRNLHTKKLHTLNLTSGTCHPTSTGVLSAKHTATNGFSTTIESSDIQRVIMHYRVSINSYNINAQSTR